MGITSSYSSPKFSAPVVSPKASSYESSKFSAPVVSPKASSYESSKFSAPSVESRVVSKTLTKGSTKTSLNNFRDLLTDYLDICAQVELVTTNLEQLQAKKRVLEEKITNDPDYEKFATLFNSMKGPTR